VNQKQQEEFAEASITLNGPIDQAVRKMMAVGADQDEIRNEIRQITNSVIGEVIEEGFKEDD